MAKDKIYNWILDNWKIEKESNNHKNMAKLIRLYINQVKGKSGIAEGHKDTARTMIDHLEKEFGSQPLKFDEAATIVAAIHYGRKNIKSSGTQYGSKFNSRPRRSKCPVDTVTPEQPENDLSNYQFLSRSMDHDNAIVVANSGNGDVFGGGNDFT